VAISNPCALLDRLIQEPHENEWLEFKVNNADPHELGEYVSALAKGSLGRDDEGGCECLHSGKGNLTKNGALLCIKSMLMKLSYSTVVSLAILCPTSLRLK
jgi:hypothetical protein